MWLASAVCGLVLLAVPLAGPAGAAPKSGAQLRSVEIAVGPLEPVAQVFYAKERGFFRRQGLDVTITILRDPTQGAAAVLSGDVDVSVAQLGGLAFLEVQRAPIKAIAAGALYDPMATSKSSAMVAMPSKRIRSARDLVGKTVVIDRVGTIAHAGVLKWLRTNGVDPNEVDFTAVPFAQMLGPLTRGDVDAAMLPEPWVTHALDRGARRVAYTLDSVCSQRCLLTMFIARKDVDADLAARFRNAVQAASFWANQKRNREAAVPILARYVGLKPALIRRISRTEFATRMRVRDAQQWIDVYAELGLIPKPFPAADLLN
jgi:NitT/TauT family transport system substrate-binding protein